MKSYKINEIFLSIQGEGARAGTLNIFIRFANCNLRCTISSVGFDCDTEFISGKERSLSELLDELKSYPCKSVILTGGEPALQIDESLIRALESEGYYIAIETNGTCELPTGINWITVSPKSAEHTIKLRGCSEVKYVRSISQAIPRTEIRAEHYYVSPAFETDGSLKRETLNWCIDLLKENPKWKLSVQMHKLLGLR